MMDLSNEPDKKVRVLLFGLGAIGGFYAFILSQSPTVELTIVARSNFEKVKKNGLYIESLNHGHHHTTFDHVCSSVEECTTQYDYIVCVNKATTPTTIPPIFKHITSRETTFVVLQNGVGNEEFFQAVYPENTIISGVIWVHAIQVQPNVIEHRKPENTEIGLHRNEKISEDVEVTRTQRFCDLMIAGGTNIDLVDDIQLKRWEKVIWNSAWNPITMLTMVDTEIWLSDSEAVATTKRLWKEGIDVARAAGVDVQYELADRLLKIIRSMPGLMASMATDAREGRPMEVEVILGGIVKKAKLLGIDTPVLTTLYTLSRAVNDRIVKESTDRATAISKS